MGVLAGFIVTLGYGGHLTISGELPVGSYGVLVFLTQRLLWPLTGLAQTFNMYERSMASFARVQGLLKEPIQIKDGLKSALPNANPNLIFQNVQFQYPNGVRVFENFNLTIPAQKSVALVGTTGSGKSTLVKLLLRFYDPQGGTIQMTGIPLQDLLLHSLRKTIGLVSQDVYLFQGSIFENIAYGQPHATLEQVREAARIAEADDFIMSYASGYQTLVGERGQKLSGGQRQRISIARAVLKNPPVLIFDEATSAVDNETEQAIQRSLSKLTKNRTTLLIAHRLSTVRYADVIHVLEKGKIVESGTHDELVDLGKIYSGLWKIQTGA
jgi:ATP-binding cassette, subfamily B, bacterial